MDIRTGGGHWGVGAPRRRTGEKNWGEPARWNRSLIAGADIGRKVFACSMADFFDNEVDPAWRAEAWPIIEQTRALRWQLCTKRIGNVLKMVPQGWISDFLQSPSGAFTPSPGWPSHVGIIATMVNQDEVDRDMPKLLALKAYGAPWVGVSYEPALGPITFRKTGWPDWVIIGGESGPKARPFEVWWGIDLLTERLEIAKESAVFVKQLGASVVRNGVADFREGTGKRDNPEHWPTGLKIQEFPAALQN